MSPIVQKIHDIGTRTWLRFVQALNAILISLAGAAVVVNQAYPGVITGAINKLPPALGIPLLFVLGFLVHYSLRRAKVSPND